MQIVLFFLYDDGELILYGRFSYSFFHEIHVLYFFFFYLVDTFFSYMTPPYEETTHDSLYYYKNNDIGMSSTEKSLSDMFILHHQHQLMEKIDDELTDQSLN